MNTRYAALRAIVNLAYTLAVLNVIGAIGPFFVIFADPDRAEGDNFAPAAIALLAGLLLAFIFAVLANLISLLLDLAADARRLADPFDPPPPAAPTRATIYRLAIYRRINPPAFRRSIHAAAGHIPHRITTP